MIEFVFSVFFILYTEIFSTRYIINKHEKNVDTYKAYRDLCDWSDSLDTLKLNANVLRHSLKSLEVTNIKLEDELTNELIKITD